MAYFIENSPLVKYTRRKRLPACRCPVLGLGPNAVRIGAGLRCICCFATIFFVGYVLARRIVGSPPSARLLRAIRQNTGRWRCSATTSRPTSFAAFVIAALYAGSPAACSARFKATCRRRVFAGDLRTTGVQTIVRRRRHPDRAAVGAAVWLWLRDNLQLVPGLAALWKLVLALPSSCW